MSEEKDLDPDEVRQAMHSAVENIRERLPTIIGPEPAPNLLGESKTTKVQSG
jgi:hypothetical protein